MISHKDMLGIIATEAMEINPAKTSKEVEERATFSKPGASFHRGKSKQDYVTPKDFRNAVYDRWTMPTWDLAADQSNAFCVHPGASYFDERANSLVQDWHKLDGLLWLNCPFGNIAPWAKKCFEEAQKGAEILLLVPAAVGSNWFANFVAEHSMVYFLRPRLCFDGKNSFPKDCLLAGYNIVGIGYQLWRWK